MSKYRKIYLSRIRHIVVVMVNNSSLLLIKLNATFTAQLPQRVTCSTRNKNMNKDTFILKWLNVKLLLINWPISELAAIKTLPPPSMKDVIVSTFIFPPKSENKCKKILEFHSLIKANMSHQNILGFDIKKTLTLNRWWEDDQMVVEELSIFDQRQGRVVSSLECEVKTSIWNKQYLFLCIGL